MSCCYVADTAAVAVALHSRVSGGWLCCAMHDLSCVFPYLEWRSQRVRHSSSSPCCRRKLAAVCSVNLVGLTQHFALWCAVPCFVFLQAM
jgi:hypothetical protein